MKECSACKHCFPDQYNNCPTDGTPLASSIPGDTTLDARYQLEQRLGQGGMGIVFKARHIFLKTSYAIKVILPDLVGNDPMLATRFRQEAMVAARIGHRNIVNVTDFGVVGGKMPYLVMDFIQGRSLQELLAKEGRLAPGPALEIMTSLCAGVGAAHHQGIVHRDLKPLNVMLQDGKPLGEAVKVLDFGLAKIKSGELLGSFVAAQTTGLMGSPYYMAPEQWSDEEPDARADIYSLGVILFQMLAGDVPFKGPSLPSIMKKHLSDSPPSFLTMGVNVPADIETVVRRSLAKRRDDRMSSVDEFISELREAVASANASLARISMEATRNFAVEADLLDISLPQDRTILTESQQRIEDEADRLTREFEEAQQRADEARRRAEEATRKRAEEEAARRKAEEEAARKLEEEEAARQHAEELDKQRAEEAATRARAAEEAARRLAEEAERQRAEDEEARRAAAEEAVRLAREVQEAKKRAEEARLRAEEEARKRSEEQEARKRAEEEAQRLVAEVAEAQRRAEEARNRAEEEARKRAEEEAERRRAEEEEDRLRAEESMRIHAESDLARKKAEADADRLAQEVAEAQQRAEEAKVRAEEEAQRRAEAEEARKRAEEEARKLAMQVAEVQKRAEEARKRAEEEAARQAALEEQRLREDQLAAEMRAQSQPGSLPQASVGSAPPGSLGAVMPQANSFPAGAGFVSEETIVHGGSQSMGAQSSWPSGAQLSNSVAAVEPKRSYVIPVGIGVAILLVILVGGAAALFSGKLLTAKNTPSPTPAPSASPSETATPTKPPKPEMVKIQGGTYQMGLLQVSSNNPYDLAQYPAHAVKVNSFWMDKTEVTNAEYADFVNATHYAAPSYWNNGKPTPSQEQWPVTNVSLADVRAFADWRSKRDGVKYRLPTEEEWEYAARNGSQATVYPWGNEWGSGKANVDANSPRPVGTFPPGASSEGILDLIGNVWEWTSTKAAPYPGNTLLVIPQGQVIIRGGAYTEPSTGSESITSTRRSWVPPSDKQAAIGFRLVRED